MLAIIWMISLYNPWIGFTMENTRYHKTYGYNQPRRKIISITDFLLCNLNLNSIKWKKKESIKIYFSIYVPSVIKIRWTNYVYTHFKFKSGIKIVILSKLYTNACKNKFWLTIFEFLNVVRYVYERLILNF